MATVAIIYALTTCVSMLSHHLTAVIEQPPAPVQQRVVVTSPSSSDRQSIVLMAAGSTDSAATVTADLYPSERTAVEAMIESFITQLRNTPNFNERQSHIYIGELAGEPPDRPDAPNTADMRGVVSVQTGTAIEKGATTAAIRIAIDQLQLRMKGVRVQERSYTTELAANDVAIGIHLSRVKKIERSGQYRSNGYAGRVKGVLLYDDQKQALTTDFVNKRWVDDMNYFLGMQSCRDWAVGRSSQTCRDEEEADQQARRAIGAQVYRILKSREMGDLPPNVICDLVSQQLLIQRPADRFVQRLSTSDGDFVTVAILVPTTDAGLQALLPGIPVASAQEPSSSKFSGMASVVIMAVVIIFLYLLLNAFTRGYYSSMLRIGFVVLLILGGLLVMVFSVRVAFAPSARAVITR